MAVNDKKYTLKAREDEDNVQFLNELSNAAKCLENAIVDIRASEDLCLNIEIQKQLIGFVSCIHFLREAVNEHKIELQKEVEVKSQSHYYALNYFHNRSSCGVFYIESKYDKNDYTNDDEFLDALMEVTEFPDRFNYVTEINEILREDYEEALSKELK